MLRRACGRRVTGDDGGKNAGKEKKRHRLLQRVVKGVRCRKVGGRRKKGVRGRVTGETKRHRGSAMLLQSISGVLMGAKPVGKVRLAEMSGGKRYRR